MGVMLYSFFWVMQDLYRQPYLGTWALRVMFRISMVTKMLTLMLLRMIDSSLAPKEFLQLGVPPPKPRNKKKDALIIQGLLGNPRLQGTTAYNMVFGVSGHPSDPKTGSSRPINPKRYKPYNSKPAPQKAQYRLIKEYT